MENLKSTIPDWVASEAGDRTYEIEKDELDFISIFLKSSKSKFASGLRAESKSYLDAPSNLWRIIFDKYSSYQQAYPSDYYY